MWGQVHDSVRNSAINGIIPTRVGTSQVCCDIFANRQDHPHACGDKLRHIELKLMLQGSSPRVWGQASFGNKIFYAFRIIPTRVGTRNDKVACVRISRDHPHACGDKFQQVISVFISDGSSPRVWGQENTDTDTEPNDRIIPTRVGTSLYE